VSGGGGGDWSSKPGRGEKIEEGEGSILFEEEEEDVEGKEEEGEEVVGEKKEVIAS
jgi:hypothetical protein